MGLNPTSLSSIQKKNKDVPEELQSIEMDDFEAFILHLAEMNCIMTWVFLKYNISVRYL